MIDAHGLESFSIRSLGAELGVAPMTLYWHVGTKDELLALVLDELIGRVAVPEPGGHWTDRVAALLRRSEEHTSELQSRGHLVCRLLLENKQSFMMPPFPDSSFLAPTSVRVAYVLFKI